MLCDCIFNMETMTAKDKALELFNYYCLTLRFEETGDGYFTNIIQAKQCALLCVSEIINELDSERVFERIYFWNEVKEEINKL